MRIVYDDALPISARRQEISDAIRDHQVVVVAGETGSGKTTQLPKIAYELGARAIAHTQPRRIAARSVAARIAQECSVELGTEVGYAVRFDEKRGKDTAVALVTDGLLLAEINHDRDLRRYDTIIVDEAHERSLAIDFLLGYLKRLLPRRPDLKLIVTSATIDVERFSEMFDGAPVVEVSGRTYPVEIRYRPPEGDDQLDAIAAGVDELPREGDILVFLSGEREIRDAAEFLEAKKYPRTEILPLYGRLAVQDQQKIFASHPGRRIVLATNVAETSLTVPGIRYVIDPGYARISRYSQRLKVQRLPIEAISQASAAQRAGRCGRVADGICIRLYAEDDFDGRPEFTDPEIRRTNLASVLLQMASLDLGDVGDFPFLDPPDHRAVSDGRLLLSELGALSTGRDSTPRLTKIGRTMSALPVDPRHARQLIAADRLGCLADVLVIVSAMSIQDPRERPVDQKGQADEKHSRFKQPDSDFLSWLSLWTYLREQRAAGSHSAFRRMCRDEFLHYLRIREWHDVHSQLRRTVKDLGMKPGNAGSDPDDVHRALLAGLLSHIGLREGDQREFLGARGAKFVVWPGSDLSKKPPRWAMVGELVETSRLWGRTVAKIQPEWVEREGAHLLKRQYAEPHWSAKRGSAMARERATLYGVPVVVDRLVPLSRTDPALARELFIRHALVQGEWRTHHAFFQANTELVASIEELEERTRKRGLRVDDEVIFGFYDARVPADVVSVRHFDAWWKKTRRDSPDLLTIDPALLAVDGADEIEDQFPTTWSSESGEYEVSYVFEPGRVDDGVVVDLPLERLTQARPDEFAWNVPGHRPELVEALLRSLPKRLRRELVPVPQHAARLLETMDPKAPGLTAELVRQIRLTTGTLVEADDFDWSAVPAHLRVTFRVVDGEKELARGTDVEALRAELRPAIRADLEQAAASQARTGITTWDVGRLDRSVTVGQATGYPALVDDGASVSLRVLETPQEQDVALVRGESRLLALSVPSTTKRIIDGLDLRQKLTLGTSPYQDLTALVEDCRAAALDHLVRQHGGPVWDDVSFLALREKVRPDLHDVTERAVHDVLRTIEKLAGVSPGPDAVGEDVRVQLSWLVYPGFVRDAGVTWLRRHPVYVDAARRRLSRPMDDAGVAVQELEARFHDKTSALSATRRLAADVQHVRWALEELRVGTFAQGLGTAFSVSVKRVTKLIDELAV
ncbi:ATP-dependent RNA helicase HrpA [Aeromicrobium sp. Root495]|uniref:ATP-dependent RNA helicase HrpA n=1 Tax=Aeromicrobium sp. Root495 TaxID=1736550 RepID=UPI0006F484B8|nr:ATP-dependent RNA helicase HrpA [Aeromicrobium sp. Root495]KQY59330.1 ATP-dependent RNA helicase HrpA [Aeromicrobium sp. Root495]